MNQNRKLVSSLLVAAGLGTLFVAPVFAEPECGPMRGRDYRHEQYSKNMEQHQKMLHETLKLTPEQEPGWKKLIDSEQPMRAADAAKREDWSKLSAPERADKMLELSKVRQQHLSDHVVALKAFYATLTPAQQKSFEDFHAGSRSGMGGKRGPGMNKVEKAPATQKP